MRRFLSGALPFYAVAGLAMCMHLVLYKTNLFDLNAIVQDATASSWFPAFIFVCVLLESVFPYFGYFPGTVSLIDRLEERLVRSLDRISERFDRFLTQSGKPSA